MPIEIIYGYAHLKKLAAMANHELVFLEKNKKDLIVKSVMKLSRVKLTTTFPLVIWQTGFWNPNQYEYITRLSVIELHVILGNKIGGWKKIIPTMMLICHNPQMIRSYIYSYCNISKAKEITIPGLKIY